MRRFVHITGLVESAPPSDMKQEDRFWNNWFFIEMQMRLMFSQVDQNPRNNEITLDEVTAWARNFVPAIPNPLPAQVTEMWNNLIKGFDTSGNNAISWDGRLPQKEMPMLLLSLNRHSHAIFRNYGQQGFYRDCSKHTV